MSPAFETWLPRTKTLVIPREGVEKFARACSITGQLPTWVIPREGVESFTLPIHVVWVESYCVIPREGVESNHHAGGGAENAQ